MLGALGFSMIAIFNNAERIPLNLSPVFIAVFAFCFGNDYVLPDFCYEMSA